MGLEVGLWSIALYISGDGLLLIKEIVAGNRARLIRSLNEDTIIFSSLQRSILKIYCVDVHTKVLSLMPLPSILEVSETEGYCATLLFARERLRSSPRHIFSEMQQSNAKSIKMPT